MKSARAAIIFKAEKDFFDIRMSQLLSFKGHRRPPLAAACLSACLALGAMPALPQAAQASGKASPKAAQKAASQPKAQKAASGAPRRDPKADVTLDFENAEIEAVARAMATLSGRNVVVDPRVKGTITLSSTVAVTPAEAMRLFAAQLRTQGFSVVETDGMSLVLPEAEAKLRSGSVRTQAPRSTGSGQVQTQIFRLMHENAANLVPVLRPLISPNNTINVSPGGNALVITDYSDNLQRMGRIIAALDISNATGVEVVPLKHAVAADLAPLVLRLAEAGGSAMPAAPGNGNMAVQASAGSGVFPTTLIPEPRSNSIIVRAANPAKLAQIKGLIQQLDLPSATHDDGSSGNIHIVHLKNADAVKLAVTLRAALAALPGQQQGATGGASSAAAAAPTGSSSSSRNSASSSVQSSGSGLNTGPSIDAEGDNQPSTGGQIQADPATNSLIISAPGPVYRELREVINKLDERRAQVFVESLIAEVRTDKAAEFGIQWQGLVGRRDGANVGIIGTNYNTGGTNIISLASQFRNGMPSSDRNVVMPAQGMNLAFGHRVNGLFTLGALANFLQATGTGNVLSTPTLLTLDNEEAKIIVGQNVPFVTGSYTNTGGSNASLNPFQTYDRQDVGLTLRVRPQISENGTVKMVIYQETSSVVKETQNAAQGPTTNKRAIESSVLVEDGSIVVLGGLLEDNYAEKESKVPVLGDVPVVGNLFRSRERGYVKTNLMVFLRPVVVRDAPSTEQYSVSRYDMMRAAQQDNQPDPSSVLKVNIAPVMPPAQPVYKDEWKNEAPPAPLNHGSAAPAPGMARQEKRSSFRMPASGEANYMGD